MSIGHPVKPDAPIFPQLNIASGLEIRYRETSDHHPYYPPPQLYVALRQFVQLHSVHPFSVTPQSITILVIHPDTAPQCPNHNQTTGFAKKKEKRTFVSVPLVCNNHTPAPCAAPFTTPLHARHVLFLVHCMHLLQNFETTIKR